MTSCRLIALVAILLSYVCADLDIIHVFAELDHPVEITCNDNQVISIQNITVNEYTTECPHDSCSVDVQDKEEILQRCNGQQICNITSDLQTNCLKDNGFYNLDFSCQEILPLSCDFEQEEELCGWRINGTSNYIWKTGTRFMPDHTLGNGTFIYTDASKNGNSKTYFKSGVIYPTKNQCLTFWYKFYKHWNNKFNVYLEIYGGSGRIDLWSTSVDTDDEWYNQILPLHANYTYKVVFEAVRSYWSDGRIALDDIVIANMDCYDFEVSLSHLTKETSGQSSHSKTCRKLQQKTVFGECSYNYISFDKSTLGIYPAYKRCLSVYEYIGDNVKSFCENSESGDFCNLNLKSAMERNSSCFRLNSLVVEYGCSDVPKVDALNLQNDNSTTITAVVIAVVVILASAVIVLIFVFRRSKHCQKDPKSGKKQQSIVNETSMGNYQIDYTGNQFVALPRTSAHLIQPAMVQDGDKQYDEIGLDRNEDDSYTDIERMTEEPTHPSYEYVGTEINDSKPIKSSRSPDTSGDIEIRNEESQYSLARNVNLDSNITEDYSILDPNETSFNWSNARSDVQNGEYNKSDGRKITDNNLTTEIDDHYDVSNEGTYDASNDGRHKEADDSLYSHAVDNVYDTSSHKRSQQENENAYDHFIESRPDNDDV